MRVRLERRVERSGSLLSLGFEVARCDTSTRPEPDLGSSRQFLRFYETGLEGYTYLEEP